MNVQIIAYSAIAISIIAIFVSVYGMFTVRKGKEWRRLFKDESEQPENLEEILSKITAKLLSLEGKEETTRKDLDDLAEVTTKTIQRIGLVRFNSQADDGGNLSFCLALLDNNQTGVIVTSLHGRQHNRIYTKKITKGKTESALSDEETNAIIQAVQY